MWTVQWCLCCEEVGLWVKRTNTPPFMFDLRNVLVCLISIEENRVNIFSDYFALYLYTLIFDLVNLTDGRIIKVLLYYIIQTCQWFQWPSCPVHCTTVSPVQAAPPVHTYTDHRPTDAHPVTSTYLRILQECSFTSNCRAKNFQHIYESPALTNLKLTKLWKFTDITIVTIIKKIF